jgi:hypothetical protein
MTRHTQSQHLLNHTAHIWNTPCLYASQRRNGAARTGLPMKIYLAMLLFGTLMAAIRAGAPAKPR